jgi:predicted Zn-dependent protease
MHHRGSFMAAADSIYDYLMYGIRQMFRRFWHFILEAKDIRPSAVGKLPLSSGMERVKKVFKVRVKQSDQEPDWMPELADVADPAVEKAEPASSPEAVYLAAIKKDPNDLKAYESLARLYLQNRNFSEASEIFQFLIQKQEKDIYWSNLGIAQYGMKKFQEAAVSFDKSLKINSKVPARWVNFALCFEALNQYSKAVKAVGKALELAPRNISYLMLLADLYEKVDNPVRGEEVLAQILVIEPMNKTAREKLMKLKISE